METHIRNRIEASQPRTRRYRQIVLGVAGIVCLGTFACSDSDGSGVVTVRTPKAPGAIVAYRDGDAPWTVTNGAAGSVRFSAPSGTYTVVVGCNASKRHNVDVYAATTAELSTIDYQAECGGETQVISGSANSGASAVLYFGQNAGALSNPSTYSLQAPRGTGDLVATAGSRVAVIRDVAVGASPVTIDVDFFASANADIRQHRFTLASISETDTTAYASLWTRGGTYALLCSSSGAAGCGLPASALVSGDLQVMGVIARSLGVYRHARWAAREAADRQVVFPINTLAPPQVDVSAQQTKAAMSVSWPGAPSAPVYRVTAGQYADPLTHRYWQLVATEDYVGAGGSLSLPDMSGVTGWDPGLDLIVGLDVSWAVVAESGTSIEELVRWYPTHERTVLAEGYDGSMTPQ